MEHFVVPQNIVTWMNSKEYVDYDFSDDYTNPDYSYSYQNSNNPSQFNNFYDYNSDGITGANVLSEMRPGPTQPSFITGQNVIRYLFMFYMCEY